MSEKIKNISFYIVLLLFLLCFCSSIFKSDYNRVLNIIFEAKNVNQGDILLKIDNSYYSVFKFKNIFNQTINKSIKNIDVLINKKIEKNIENILVFKDVSLIYIDNLKKNQKQDIKICKKECTDYSVYNINNYINKNQKIKYLNSFSMFETLSRSFRLFFSVNNEFFSCYILLFAAAVLLIKYKNEIKFKIPSVILTLFIIFLLFLMRIEDLSLQKPWGDEWYSIYAANPNLSVKNLLSDPGNPPFYYFVLRMFIILFRPDIFSMRFLSVVFSVLSGFIIWLFLKKILNIKLANLGLFLYGINLILIYYSKEIRCYSLCVLLVCACVFFLFKIFKYKTTRYSFCYFICACLLVNSHYYGIFFVFGNLVFAALFFLIRRRKKDLFSFLFLNLLVLASFLPYFFYTGYREALLNTNFNSHFEPLSFSLFKNSAYYIFGGAFSLLLSFCIFIKAIFEKKVNLKIKILLSYCFFNIWFVLLCAFAASYLIRPLIVYRYFIVVVPLFIIFLSLSVFCVLKYYNKYLILVFILQIFFIQNYTKNNLVDVRKRCTTSFNTFELSGNLIKNQKQENIYYILRPSDYFYKGNYNGKYLKNANYIYIKELKNNFDTDEIVKNKIKEIKKENKNAIIFTPLLKSTPKNAQNDNYTCYFNSLADVCIWKIE